MAASRRPPAGAARTVVAAGVNVAVPLLIVVHAEMVFAGLIAIPVLVAVFLRPQRGVLLFAALLPYDGVTLLIHSSGVIRAWKEIVALLVLAASLLAPSGARGAQRRRLPPWLPAACAWLLIGAISAGVFLNRGGLTGFRIYYFYALVAVAMWRCPLSERDRDRLVTIFMANALLTSVYAVIQEVLGVSRLHSFGYSYNTIRTTHGHLRAFSTFAYQTPFAFFLMVALIVGLSAALSDPRRRRNRAFLCCVPLMALALFFTYERGAWFGLAGALAYLAVRRYRFVLYGIPLLLFAVVLLPGSVQSASTSGSSFGQRTSNWSSHLPQIAESPLGHGIGSSGAAAAKIATVKATGSATAATSGDAGTYNPDDGYVTVAYDLGILGIWAYLLLLASVGLTAHRAARDLTGPDRALADATTAFIIAVAVGSVTTVVFELAPLDSIFWLLTAAIPVASVGMPESDEPAGRRLMVPGVASTG